jgi:hypothetical protein
MMNLERTGQRVLTMMLVVLVVAVVMWIAGAL